MSETTLQPPPETSQGQLPEPVRTVVSQTKPQEPQREIEKSLSGFACTITLVILTLLSAWRLYDWHVYFSEEQMPLSLHGYFLVIYFHLACLAVYMYAAAIVLRLVFLIRVLVQKSYLAGKVELRTMWPIMLSAGLTLIGDGFMFFGSESLSFVLIMIIAVGTVGQHLIVWFMYYADDDGGSFLKCSKPWRYQPIPKMLPQFYPPQYSRQPMPPASMSPYGAPGSMPPQTMSPNPQYPYAPPGPPHPQFRPQHGGAYYNQPPQGHYYPPRQ